MGDTAEAGARPTGQDVSSSGAGGTPTPTVEEVMRERDAFKQSLQAVTRERDEWKVKAAQPSGDGAGSSGDAEEDLLTTKTVLPVVERAIAGWWEKQQRAANEQLALAHERQTWLVKAAEEVPESLDKASPVYKKALELFNDPKEGLSRQVNGQVLPTYPNAEYVAFVRAKSLVGAPAASAVADHRAGAQFASAGGPASGGAPAGSSGDLSDEEFMKLSPEERARYQERRFLEKHGVTP